MKRINIIITLFIALILFLSFVTYMMLPTALKAFIGAFVDVPRCNARIADKLGTEPEIVRSYIVESLTPGMERSEVEEALSQITPVTILDTNYDGTHIALRVKLCNNPFGDLVLDVYYSKEGDLIRAEDAWAD